eukprot:GCRY01000361.1.p1 GENE.GCRY01000361.1~~GCRY01000361.1.p1  ORF type:complete len:183 (+),score=24.83 GCRY01000361.1:96-644(+)
MKIGVVFFVLGLFSCFAFAERQQENTFTLKDAFIEPSSPSPADLAILLKHMRLFVDGKPGISRGMMAESLVNSTEHVFILDVRQPADYCKGHIPGAVNIPASTILDDGSLSQLPTDNTPIICVCYTGHLASQTNALLNTLGYNAWTLMHGMLSWRDESKVPIYSFSHDEIIVGGNYPMNFCH